LSSSSFLHPRFRAQLCCPHADRWLTVGPAIAGKTPLVGIDAGGRQDEDDMDDVEEEDDDEDAEEEEGEGEGEAREASSRRRR
jgi:hypothetical protein